jgi:uncharacterized protein YcbX
MTVSGTITGLYRYPVKGLSPDALDSMELREGVGLAYDRTYALALGSTEFDPAQPVPLPKSKFLMLMRDESLALLSTRLDTATGVLTVTCRGGEKVAADLNTPVGRAEMEAFFTAFAGEAACGHVRVVSAPRHRFTDIGAPVPALMNCVSLINLASLREVEAVMGRHLDPLRFRANIYVDGLPAWSEFDLLDRTLTVGALSFCATRRTRRCPATNVNLETAMRDADVPKALREHFGHGDLGIYLAVQSSGTLIIGQTFAVVD